MNRRAWFYRYVGWNGAIFYWPCHWLGALLMMATIALAFCVGGGIVGVSCALDHPALGWFSIVAVIAIYGGFARFADRYARD